MIAIMIILMLTQPAQAVGLRPPRARADGPAERSLGQGGKKCHGPDFLGCCLEKSMAFERFMGAEFCCHLFVY